MRKKFTMLLASLFLVLGSAWAQVVVEGNAYYLKVATLENAYIDTKTSHSDNHSNTIKVTSSPVPTYFKASENGTWLISVNPDCEGGFLTVERWCANPGQAKGDPWTIVSADVPGLYYLTQSEYKDNGDENVYLGRNEGVALNEKLYTDQPVAKAVKIEFVDASTVEMVNVTYSFTYNNIEKYTQTETVEVGGEFPEITVVFPMGVTATKPAGTVSTDNANQTIVLNVDNTKLPFAFAADYASIKHWYYIQMHSSGGRYIQAMADHIEWLDVDKNVAEADSYTWGFVGNPLDGFKLVNKSTGETKAVNSNGEGNPALGDINTATSWTIKPSGTNPEAQYFCFQHPGNNNYMNAQNGKIAFWSDADQGSTMWVTERDLSGVTELQALIESANAMVDALDESIGVGSVTRESLAELEKEIAKAQAAADAKENCIAAQIELQAALDALETIQPEIGKFYTIVSACSKDNDARNGQSVYVNNDGGLNFSSEGKVSKWFQFVPSGDPGKFYLYNVKSEKYLSTANAHNGGQEEAKATSTDGAVKVTITNMGKGNIVKIVPEGGAMIHAQTSGSKVVAWNNTAYDEASAWTLVEVENPGVAIVGDESYATLADAIAAVDVEKNGVVKLIADVNASEIITINNAITLDGNGKTLTSTAGRAINVDCAGDVAIKNLTISASGERGINVINKAVNLTLNSVDVTADSYAVNLAATAANTEVAINGGSLTSKLIPLNVWTANAAIALEGVILNSTAEADNETYAAIQLNKGAEGTTVSAKNCTLNVTDTDSPATSNWTTTGEIVLDGTTGEQATIVATIGAAGYTTLANAIEAAKADDEVTLIRNIEVSEIITIDKAITLDGNDKTLTSTAGRAINVETEGDVVIKNLTISASGERGINVINKAVNLTLNSVDVTADSYAVNLAATAANTEVAINGGSLTSKLIPLNVWTANAAIALEGVILNSTAEAANETYAAIQLNKGAEGTTVNAKNCTLNVTDHDSPATSNWTTTGEIVLDGTTGEQATIVATIGAAGYTTLAKAIEAAKADDEVTLIRNIEVSEIITIDKAITLDGNDKTLTSTAGRAINVDCAGDVAIKNLTISASGERGINVINKAVNLTLNSVDVTADSYAVNLAATAANTTVAINGGSLTSKLIPLNVWTANAAITLEGVILNSTAEADNETYAAIQLNKGAEGTTVSAKNCTLNVTDTDSPTTSNWTTTGAIVLDGTTGEQATIVATIGAAGYTTLANAIEAAKADDEVTLIRNIEVSEIITIDKAITLDGNDKTLTSTAGRAINVETEGDVVIKNLTISASGERGINVINKAVNLTLNSVDVTADSYAVNLAATAANTEVAINGGSLTSKLIPLNVWTANAAITLEGVILNSTAEADNETYAAIQLNKGAEGTTVSAKNCTLNVTDTDSPATSNWTTTGAIVLDGTTGEQATIVATIGAAGYTTLANAIEAAKADDEVTLIRNIEVSEIITIDKDITLNGNGKTLTSTGCEFPIVVSQSAEVNFVDCNLTYTREFAEVNTWYALYVPFAIDKDFLTKYDVAEFSRMNTGSMTITMVEEGTLLDANTPYFIRVKADADKEAKTLKITVDGAELEFNASSTPLGDDVATLNGVYTETEASTIAGAYAMSSGAFKQAADPTQTLKPFRFYLMFNASQAAAALRTISINVDGEEGTTAIENSIFTNGETVVYDLQGRRVENPTKGIYIVNGVKVVIK